MTPREKAEELLHKMYVVDAYDDYDDISMEYRYAKLCALIAVDELIKENESIENIVNGGLNKQYWESVKQEIEKL
jgi:hypothetical protein